jgi:hypothetical protein
VFGKQLPLDVIDHRLFIYRKFRLPRRRSPGLIPTRQRDAFGLWHGDDSAPGGRPWLTYGTGSRGCACA